MNHNDLSFGAPDQLTTEEAAELANVLPPTLEEAYAEGRSDEREDVRMMLREELACAKRQARENGGNPRYDYYADAIEMILGNLD
jgi:uncharacterized protein (DUF2267 family)